MPSQANADGLLAVLDWVHEPVHHTNQIYAYLPCVNGLERDDSAHEVHLLRPHIAMTLQVLAKPSALQRLCIAATHVEPHRACAWVQWVVFLEAQNVILLWRSEVVFGGQNPNSFGRLFWTSLGVRLHTFRGVRSANVSGVRGHAFCVIYKDIETLRFSVFGRRRCVLFV